MTLLSLSRFQTTHILAQSAALGHPHAGARRPSFGAADVTEHLSEPGRHEVVEDGVDGRAQVEEESRDDVE